MKKPELMAPAGDLEKLKLAVLYGADAVYCAGQDYGLREGAGNLTIEELKEAVEFAHSHCSRIYVTVNIIPHNQDLEHLPEYLHKLEELGVDALIIADPGVLKIIRDQQIRIPLHLSTQANTVNHASVSFWAEQGFERVILARELSCQEISEIRQQSELELEIFVHGSMCISYSGRCLLSNYLAERDANRGRCAHSCRWQYYLVEAKRPDEYFPILEDERGSYIMNSRDLCLIEYLPEIVQAGVDAIKIEGRMKSLHYVAAVTAVYRKVLDSYFQDPENYQFDEKWYNELQKVTNRGFTSGFFLSPPGPEDHNYDSSAYRRDYDFIGLVREYLPRSGEALVEVRNKLYKGNSVEIIGPEFDSFQLELDYIIDQESGESVETAPHPRQLIRIPVKRAVKPYYLLRRQKE